MAISALLLGNLGEFLLGAKGIAVATELSGRDVIVKLLSFLSNAYTYCVSCVWLMVVLIRMAGSS